MTRALLDTSALIAAAPRTEVLDRLDEAFVSAVSIAELTQGPLLATDELERARRQRRLQDVLVALPEPLPFDTACASAYGTVVARTRAADRHVRSRFADLLIAATALANGLVLATRNPADVVHLEPALVVVEL